MPRIPELNENVRMNVGSPVPVGSSGQGQMMGDAVEHFGKGLTSFGSDYVDIASAQNKVKRSLDVAEGRNFFVSRAQEHLDEALRNGSADGSDYVERFNKNFDKDLSEYTSKVSDGVTKQSISVEANQVRNQAQKVLYDKARKNFTANTQKRTADLLNTHLGVIYEHPELADTELAKFMNTVEQSKLAFMPGDDEKVIGVAKKQVAETVISSLESRGQFQAARKMAVTKYAAEFKSEERQKILDRISRSETEMDRRTFEANRRAEQQATKMHAEDQERFSGAVLNLYNDWTQGGKSELPTEARKRMEYLINEGMASDKLSKVQGTYLRSLLNKDFQVADEKVQLGLVYDLHNGQDPKIVKQKAMELSVAGNLSPQNAQSVIREADQVLKQQQAAGGQAKSPALIIRKRTALQMIDSAFGKEGIGDFDFSDDKKRMKVQALREWSDLVQPPNGSKGLDYITAADKIVRKYKGDALRPMYIPGLDPKRQSTVEGLQSLGRELKQKFDAGKMPLKTYKQKLEQIGESMKALQRGKPPKDEENK